MNSVNVPSTEQRAAMVPAESEKIGANKGDVIPSIVSPTVNQSARKSSLIPQSDTNDTIGGSDHSAIVKPKKPLSMEMEQIKKRYDEIRRDLLNNIHYRMGGGIRRIHAETAKNELIDIRDEEIDSMRNSHPEEIAAKCEHTYYRMISVVCRADRQMRGIADFIPNFVLPSTENVTELERLLSNAIDIFFNEPTVHSIYNLVKLDLTAPLSTFALEWRHQLISAIELKLNMMEIARCNDELLASKFLEELPNFTAKTRQLELLVADLATESKTIDISARIRHINMGLKSTFEKRLAIIVQTVMEDVKSSKMLDLFCRLTLFFFK